MRMAGGAAGVLIACAVIGAACKSCSNEPPNPPPQQVPPERIDARDAGGASGLDGGEAEAPEPPGKIEGVISFTGAPPRMPPIKRTQDPACAQMPKTEEAVRVKDGKLENVF